MFWSSFCSLHVLWQPGRDPRRPTIEVLVMELTGVARKERGTERKGIRLPWRYQQTLKGEGVAQDLTKCHGVWAATGMSECSCVPRHRAWARPWARTARTSQECSGWRDMEKTSRPPRCGFSYPQPQNGGLPEEIWKTPQRAKRDLIYKLFFFFPKKLWAWHSSGYDKALWKFFPAKVRFCLFFCRLPFSKVVSSLWGGTWDLRTLTIWSNSRQTFGVC